MVSTKRTIMQVSLPNESPNQKRSSDEIIKQKIKDKRDDLVGELKEVYFDHIASTKPIVEKVSAISKDKTFSVEYVIDTLRKLRKTKAPVDDMFHDLLDYFQYDPNIVFENHENNEHITELKAICDTASKTIDKLYLTVFKDFQEVPLMDQPPSAPDMPSDETINQKIQEKRDKLITELNKTYSAYNLRISSIIKKLCDISKDKCFSVNYVTVMLHKINEHTGPATDMFNDLIDYFRYNPHIVFENVQNNACIAELESVCDTAFNAIDKLYLTAFKDFLEADEEVCNV